MDQAIDEDGNVWAKDSRGEYTIFVRGPQAQMPADPKFPYEGDQAAATLNKTQTDANVARATAGAKITQAQAAARKAVADAAAAEAAARRGPEKSASEVQREDKQNDREKKAAIVRNIMGEVRAKYERSLKGQPFSRAFGATEYIDGLPANEDFSKTADGMLALIRPMVAMGAKDGDSDKEMEIFRSYIPNNDDSDRTIESKFRNLEYLLNGVTEGKMPSELIGQNRDETPAINEPRQMIAGTGGTGAMQAATGETYSTPEDVAVARAMNEVYRSGGGIKDMIEVSERFGRPVSLQEAQAWQQSIDYRDGTGKYKGKPGGFSPVNTPESGRRNLAEQAWGAVASSGPGTFAINAADQWAMGGLDEITGGINSALTGRDASTEIAYADLAKKAASAENPYWAGAGALTGGITQGYGFARGVPGLANALTASAPRMAGAGAVYGGVNGALESNNDRAAGAGIGALTGATGSLFGAKVVAPGMDRIMRTQIGQRASKAARDAYNATLGKNRPLGPQPEVPNFAPGERAIVPGQMDAAQAKLREAAGYGLPYSLADADPKLRMLAGSVARKSPNARELAENTFEPRARGQSDRAIEAIDRRLAPQTDIGQRRNELYDAGNTASEPLYRMADDVRTPVDPELQALLRTDTGQEALRRAKSIMSDRGEPDVDKRIFFGKDNLLTVEETPAFKTLDYVKKGMDAKLDEARNPVSGVLELRGNPQLQAVEGLRKRYVEALDRINPAYKDARAAYAPYAQRADALDRGYSAPATNIRPRDLQAAIGRMTPEQLPEYQRGFATKLIDDAHATRSAGNPYERIAGSPQQQEKLGMVFPEGASDFRKIYDLERDMGKTTQETLGGSPTAARLAADGQFDGPGMMALDAAGQIATGGGVSIGGLLKTGAQLAGDTWRVGLGQKKSDMIAPTLFNTNSQEVSDYLEELARRRAMDEARRQAFQRRGGLTGAILPVGGLLAVPQS